MGVDSFRGVDGGFLGVVVVGTEKGGERERGKGGGFA